MGRICGSLSIVTAAVAALVLSTAPELAGSPVLPRFEKLSDRFYYSKGGDDSGNLGVLVTEEGMLLIDTPAPKDIPSMLEMLRKLTPNPVSWVVNTDYHRDHTGGNAYFLERNIPVIGSRELSRIMRAGPKEIDPPNQEAGPRDLTALAPRFAFDRQMHLFPGGIEVRVMAVEHRAHTAGDVVIIIPSENVILAGDLFVPGGFPTIDSDAGEGSALWWIDAMRKVIESVPLIKSAMPHPKAAPSKPAAEEKTLEELVIVIPGHGPASSLKEMKNLLEAAQKLRAETGRAVSAGRRRESFLASPSLAPFRAYKNLEAYASQLYDELSKK